MILLDFEFNIEFCRKKKNKDWVWVVKNLAIQIGEEMVSFKYKYLPFGKFSKFLTFTYNNCSKF